MSSPLSCVGVAPPLSSEITLVTLLKLTADSVEPPAVRAEGGGGWAGEESSAAFGTWGEERESCPSHRHKHRDGMAWNKVWLASFPDPVQGAGLGTRQ